MGTSPLFSQTQPNDNLQLLRELIDQTKSQEPAASHYIDNTIKLYESEKWYELQRFLQSDYIKLPPGLQAEWKLQKMALLKEASDKLDNQLEALVQEIEKFSVEVKKACLEAKTASDLLPYLIRSSRFQENSRSQYGFIHSADPSPGSIPQTSTAAFELYHDWCFSNTGFLDAAA